MIFIKKINFFEWEVKFSLFLFACDVESKNSNCSKKNKSGGRK
nr:MAG TPA: hypothetical protein [Caudoviricetes sp.]DAX88501.1 MAG TPA: hypothetical protein [Caudoviricetes sp.]